MYLTVFLFRSFVVSKSVGLSFVKSICFSVCYAIWRGLVKT